jgi:hypothetical protein
MLDAPNLSPQENQAASKEIFMFDLRRITCLATLLFMSEPLTAQSVTATETKAEALWKMRAALNVAALQCQYNPSLKVVDNYNQFVKRHNSELESARTTMEGSYRRRFGKAWAGQFDRYNTRTYNSFSATGVQVAYCNKMGEVGTKSLALEPGTLMAYAEATVPEIRAIFPQPAPVAKATKGSTGKKSTKKAGKKKSSKKKR